MAIFDRIKPGQTLWTVTSQRMGNTTIRHKVVHSVLVNEVDTEKRIVVASWNGNAARRYPEYQVKQWRVNKPKVEDSFYR